MSLTSDQILNQLEQVYLDEADVLIKIAHEGTSLEEKVGALTIALGKLYTAVGISEAEKEISD